MVRRLVTFACARMAYLVVSPRSALYRGLQRWASDVSQPPYVRSYSNYGEDLVAAHLLPERDGRFVDVGSGRPVKGSNTYGLYRRGWRGVLIDPLPSDCREARRKRSGDRIIQALVSDHQGTASLFEFQPYEISTTSVQHARDLQNRGFQLVARRELPCLTLASLGLHATPEDPTFLSVDVETHELEVLAGADWTVFLPRVVCIEDSSSSVVSSLGTSPVQFRLMDLGYELWSRVGASSIYVHQRYLQQLELPPR